MIFGPHGGLVAGNGFVARVVIRGRCLLEATGDDFFSVMGVNPGAVAGDGANMGEAHRDFLENIRWAVFAIADEAIDFDDFRAQVRRFVERTNRPNAELWDTAVKAVRAGDIDLEGIRREDADSASWVEVELVAAESPSPNRAPMQPSLNSPPPDDDFKLAAGF